MNEKLLKVKGIYFYLGALFLNAFTDLGHKIIIQNTIFKIYDDSTQVMLTAIINSLILLPFILFFSPSSFLANRFSKTVIMRYSSLFAIFITLAITACYYLGLFIPAFILTFLLATQSAVYSPAKYGYIKELVGEKLISKGNAAVQSLTTVSILTGIIFYTILFENSLGENISTEADILKAIAPLGWLLVLGSIAEFTFTLMLPYKEGAKVGTRFNRSKYFSGEYLRKNIMTITRKKDIFIYILALSMFWSISQVLLASFGAYAKAEFNITNTIIIQGVMALAAIGIIVGSFAAAMFSKYYVNIGTYVLGAIGMATMLFLVPFSPNIETSAVIFLLFGVFSGLFIVPLNSYIQLKAPHAHLGTILAGNNFFQNVFMFGFLALTTIISFFNIPTIYILNMTFVMALVLALSVFRYDLINFMWFVMERLLRLRYKIVFKGLENIPNSKSLLFMGNHVSFLDWAFIQLPLERRMRFMIDREYYEIKLFKSTFKKGGAIPLSPKGFKDAFKMARYCLQSGDAVTLFPEGALTRTGELGKIHNGFEKVCEGLDGDIVIFYIDGLYGSRLSRSKEKNVKNRAWFRRKVTITYSKPIPLSSSAQEVEKKIMELENDVK